MLSSSSSVQLKVSYFFFTRQMAASYSFIVPQTASSRRLRDAAVNHLLSGQSQPTAVFNTVVSATNHSLSKAASHTECLRSDEPCFPTVTPTWPSTLLCTLTCKRRRRRGRRVRFLTVTVACIGQLIVLAAFVVWLVIASLLRFRAVTAAAASCR